MTYSNQDLSHGMKNKRIQQLQAILRQLGFDITDRDGYFGISMRQSVEEFQIKHNLEPTGVVDEETASFLESLVSANPKNPEGEDGHQPNKANSHQWEPDGMPLALNARGERVAALHDGLTKVGYRIPHHERSKQVFDVGTRSAVYRLQTKYNLRRTGEVDEKTAAALSRAVTLAETNKQHVAGRIFFDNSRPAGKVTVRLYHHGFGKAVNLLDETETDSDGYYAFAYTLNGKAANLEVRAVNAQNEETSLSKTKFNADQHEVLNLVAPASIKPPASEYKRLTEALLPQIENLEILAAVKEDDEHHDLTYLHQTTGWDARLITLMALAVKSQEEIGLGIEALYALFRAGLPTNPQRLALVSTQVIEKAIKKAHTTGIVSLSDDEINNTIQAFDCFSKPKRLTVKAPGALSTFGELLAVSGLDLDEQATFADVYFAHRGPPAELWTEARQREIPEEKIDGLRLQGKLAFLTFNNARLTQSLQQEVGQLDNLECLVDLDLYRAEVWEERLHQLDNDPQSMIPPAYDAVKSDDPRKTYAADLARKVRMSFPTQVVRCMVEKGEVTLGKHYNHLKENVATFLRQAGAKGFKLGQTPVDRFIADQNADGGLFTGIEPEAVAETTAAIKQL